MAPRMEVLSFPTNLSFPQPRSLGLQRLTYYSQVHRQEAALLHVVRSAFSVAHQHGSDTSSLRDAGEPLKVGRFTDAPY